jgi:hypothetical protein
MGRQPGRMGRRVLRHAECASCTSTQEQGTPILFQDGAFRMAQVSVDSNIRKIRTGTAA